ncbi:conserved hypothetical protein [Shewanella sediminis HAW-EB3]|uniref:Flagellar protein FliT n=1 Tax=Shewanella sediminis (strain HAW-EB3) TaxID=425104 RepID=A8FXV3_SHESH|nr:hypothetical protein [Shewanella sediminis]ABV37676.1 conserved hypothetical protein [Shewanella sediminis HAW-EB3]
MQVLPELEKLNKSVSETLIELEKIPAENETADELVLNLQELVEQRQLLLDELLTSPKDEDRPVLESQLALTQQFEQQAKRVLLHRQELLHLGRKSKRQINVYKSIGAK